MIAWNIPNQLNIQASVQTETDFVLGWITGERVLEKNMWAEKLSWALEKSSHTIEEGTTHFLRIIHKYTAAPWKKKQ